MSGAGSGAISSLDKWRATREYLAWQLRCADQRIRELEAAEDKERRQAERAQAKRAFCPGGGASLQFRWRTASGRLRW